VAASQCQGSAENGLGHLCFESFLQVLGTELEDKVLVKLELADKDSLDSLHMLGLLPWYSQYRSTVGMWSLK
jgi:hypothetical protein